MLRLNRKQLRSSSCSLISKIPMAVRLPPLGTHIGIHFHMRSFPGASRVAFQALRVDRFVGNCSLAYYRQKKTMNLVMAKRLKQVQPQLGVERAFGEAMRKLRQDRKISQMTLHVRTGLDRTFISDLERGIQCP